MAVRWLQLHIATQHRIFVAPIEWWAIWLRNVSARRDDDTTSGGTGYRTCPMITPFCAVLSTSSGNSRTKTTRADESVRISVRPKPERRYAPALVGGGWRDAIWLSGTRGAGCSGHPSAVMVLGRVAARYRPQLSPPRTARLGLAAPECSRTGGPPPRSAPWTTNPVGHDRGPYGSPSGARPRSPGLAHHAIGRAARSLR